LILILINIYLNRNMKLLEIVIFILTLVTINQICDFRVFMPRLAIIKFKLTHVGTVGFIKM